MAWTKEMRQSSEDIFLPHMEVINGRMFLTQKMSQFGEVKIDATGLYYFLKEMFTTDWQSKVNEKE